MEHVFVEQKEEKWDFVERNAENVDERRKRKRQREYREQLNRKGNGGRKPQQNLGNQLLISTGEFVISNVHVVHQDLLFKGKKRYMEIEEYCFPFYQNILIR